MLCPVVASAINTQKLLILMLVGLCVFLFAASAPVPARADVQSEVDDLEDRLDAQQKLIEKQQRMLDAQAKELGEQKKRLDRRRSIAEKSKKKQSFALTGTSPRNVRWAAVAKPAPRQKAEEQSSMTPPASPEPEKPVRPQVAAVADQGGVLSPKGMLTFENTLEYTNTTRNLFTFNGVELAQVVLVGAITDNAVEHQVVQESARLRLGITNRLEADIHVPYVYRNDAISTTNTTTGIQSVSSVQVYELGDIDAGLAYQMNEGRGGWPFLIGNLRYKANNADGPYDVPYDANNIATRLPTGTGFQTVEASVTAIKVSDPAVLFGNLGYVYDVSRDINRNFNQTYIGTVDPGDAINALVGVAFAINQDTSFSLGYKHSYVFSTVQHSIDLTTGVPFATSSGASQVGSLNIGLSYVLTPTTTLNFNIAAGVTNDAPDVDLTLRIPIELGKIF